MKKRGIFALILALSLMLTGCMSGGMIRPPETLADGTPWNGEWVNMAGRVGVDRPEGFELLTTNGTLEGLTIHYAAWVMGQETELEDDTYIYEGQVYLMTELCESEEAARATVQEWYGQFGSSLTVTDRESVTVEGQEFELLSYDCADSHFARGITAIWRYGDMVLVADIACADTLDLDLRSTMTAFLAGFHYA